MPIQMTLTSVLTIGIPSFILALEPNKDRIKGNLFINIISRAIPCAMTIVSSILLIMFYSKNFTFESTQVSTLCVVSSGFCGFLLLFKISKPFNIIRKILFSTMTTLFILGVTLMKNVFSLSDLSFYMLSLFFCIMSIDFVLFKFFEFLSNKLRLRVS